MTTISAAEYHATQTEAEFQRAVLDYAALHDWYCVHFPAMLANPSGWPDLTCYRNGVCRHLELKTKNGRLGPKQREVCEALFDHGFPVLVVRPDEWDRIEDALR